MCGFAGILRLGERPLPEPSSIRRMLAPIEYRGPDDSGEFLSEDVQLGVVRLAIIDLKDGQQPVTGCGVTPTCVYNGEIYNHPELRRELRERGHRISNECDTSVIPHLYEEMGADVVKRLRGMFAFALWDASERRLLLARDRLGIKPLYWAATPDYLLFASEIKALFASGLLERELDRDAVDDLLSMSYPCPPRTMFRGVQELRPAHVLTARPGRGVEPPRRWWRAPFVPDGEQRKVSFRDAAAELREALRRKVYDHLQSDVPVATYLSGGLDSSAISALVKEVTGDPPTTFSIAFASEEHDESAFARQMVEHLEAPNHVVSCDRATAELYPDAVWHTELPLQFPLNLPLQIQAMRARAEGFPVVLTGEGGDEILGGYDCFRGDKMRRLLDRPGLRALRPRVYRKLYKWHGFPEGTVELMLGNQARVKELSARFGIMPSWYDVWSSLDLDRDLLLSPGGRTPRPIDQPPEGFSELIRPDIDDLHPLDAALSFEMESRLPSWILPIGDRSSMAHSVEARVPLLDHEIVELVCPLPASYKMRGFTEKALLREAVKDLLPPAIRGRQKRPFYTPLRQWFFSEGAPDYVEELLSEGRLRDAGLFAPEVIKRFRQEILTVPEHLLYRVQLEWILVLVLGAQLLHHLFVHDFDPRRGTSSGWAK